MVLTKDLEITQSEPDKFCCPHCQDEAKDLWTQLWSDPLIQYEVVIFLKEGRKSVYQFHGTQDAIRYKKWLQKESSTYKDNVVKIYKVATIREEIEE